MDNHIIPKQKQCACCNILFPYKKETRLFCTKNCQKLFSKKNTTKECNFCGKIYNTNHKEQLFCSKSCKFKHWHNRPDAKVLNETKALIRISKKQLPVTYSMLVLKEIAGLLRIKKAKWQKSYESNQSGTKSRKQCANCGLNFVYKVVNGCPPKYCNNCKDSAQKEIKKKSRRIAKSRRKAKIRGLKNDAIDPLLVFERDKWICHICKTKTQKRLRGTYNAKAPELDHIITIADGGSHTLENVACSCRACNNQKRSKSFGQLFLFGGCAP
jgi:hypothetical protein